MSDENSDAVFTIRLPGPLRVKVERRMEGEYSTISEYLRDLIRKDTALLTDPSLAAAEIETEDAA